MKEIGQAIDVEWVEKINLEKEPVAHMISVERSPFHERDMSNICGLSVIGVTAVADSQGMIDREMECTSSRIY